MSNAWTIEPHKLAAAHRGLEGTIAVAAMPRTGKLLASDQGELVYNVAFSTDAENLCVLDGNWHSTVTLCCQRCLQPFIYTAQGKFLVSPVIDDENAKALPSCYEAVILHEGRINLFDLLEDELILALPQVPMHSEAECTVAVAVDKGTQELNQPFQILQQLYSKPFEFGQGAARVEQQECTNKYMTGASEDCNNAKIKMATSIKVKKNGQQAEDK